MAGLVDTENIQEAFRALRVLLSFVFIVGWLASTLLFWFLILDFLTIGKRKVVEVEVEVDGVPVPAPCRGEMVSLVFPFFFLAVSLVFFFFSYLLMPSD
jgi:hypothetical protein